MIWIINLNPNNDAYYQSRGLDCRPDDWDYENEIDYSSSNYDSDFFSINSNYESENIIPDSKYIHSKSNKIKKHLDLNSILSHSDRFWNISPNYDIPKLKYKKNQKNI